MRKDTNSIFVNIASYRDRELAHTVKDLYAKASRPEAVFTGILNQAEKGPDDACIIPPGNKNIRQRVFHPEESKGVGWARHLVQKLWQGEAYSLQIDSHCRFVPGWDQKLLDMLRSCGSERPLLTTYPMGYTPPDQVYQGTAVPLLFAKEFDKNGILRFVAYSVPQERAGDKPVMGAFSSGGFVFSGAELIEKVPYNPDYYFHGEEMARSATFWTHGWDIFHPHENLIFHYYHKIGETGHKKHWDDHKKWPELDKFSAKAARALMGMEEPDQKVRRSIEKYPLGAVRTLEQYQNFCGVDFKARAISEKAQQGPFTLSIA